METLADFVMQLMVGLLLIGAGDLLVAYKKNPEIDDIINI